MHIYTGWKTRTARTLIGIGLCTVFLLITAGAFSAATHANDDAIRTWSWTKDAIGIETIQIDIIRGRVETVIATNKEIRVTASIAGTKRIWTADLQQTQQGSILVIKDSYATTLPLWLHKECLPPTGRRGDFWHTDARFRITISAPKHIHVLTKIANQPRSNT
ncbi:hypothetical protein [Kordiimonas sp.]|uniref:hypothetical protein n=1 Tax=Kordiimonas sp. TaxID=1970157 RepID=UPI003A9579AD